MEHDFFQWAPIILQTTALLVGGVWALARVTSHLESKFTKQINCLRAETKDEYEQAMHAFGESLMAIRTKINDMELSAERRFQTYTPREEYLENHQALRRDMEKRWDRIEEKIDRLISR